MRGSLRCPPKPLGALGVVKRTLDGIEAPLELLHSVKNHYTHLRELAEKLQKCGFDDATIDSHVIGIFAQYETQLLRSIAESSVQSST